VEEMGGWSCTDLFLSEEVHRVVEESLSIWSKVSDGKENQYVS
jgi:hypothetical protein